MAVSSDLWAKDKQKHFVAGMAVTLVLYPLIGHYALLAAIMVGLAKEYVVDAIFSFGDPDIWDAIATALGGLSASLVILLGGMI